MAYFIQLRALFGVNPCTTVFALGEWRSGYRTRRFSAGSCQFTFFL